MSTWSHVPSSFHALLIRLPVRDTTAQGDLIGLVQFTAYTDAAGDGGDQEPVFVQLPVEVEARGVALQRATQREYDLADPTWCHAFHQFAGVQIIRPDAVHGADDATEHVVEALELPCVLDRDHVADVLHDADHRSVPVRV